MYPNLRAEQARRNMTNQEMADVLGMSRVSYESKKKTGRFDADDCAKLCNYFDCPFEYLFSKSATRNEDTA